VLNILPVPGLDGFGILVPYLSPRIRRLAGSASWYAPLLLFVLILGVPAVGNALFDASFWVFAAIGGDPVAAAQGFQEFLFWR
jgi:Zn-dependent protease